MRHVTVFVAVLLAVAFLPMSAAEGPTVEADGGEWAILYFPLAIPLHDAEYDVTFTFETVEDVGTPLSYLTLQPRPVIVYDPPTSAFIPSAAAARAKHAPIGGPASVLISGYGSIWTRGEIVGFVAAATSSAPWSLSIELRVNGTTIAPEVTRGAGAVFTPSAALGESLPMPVTGEVTVETVVTTPGWTHFEADSIHLQPIGLRELNASFANGRTWHSLGTAFGTWPGGSVWSNYVGAIGDLGDVPGTFRARVAYREVSLGVQALVVHIPLEADQLPPPIRQSWYLGSDGDFLAGL